MRWTVFTLTSIMDSGSESKGIKPHTHPLKYTHAHRQPAAYVIDHISACALTWKASVCMWSREKCRSSSAVMWRSRRNVARASSNIAAKLGVESSTPFDASVDGLFAVLCQFARCRRSVGSSCSLRPSESAWRTICSMICRTVDCSANVDNSTCTRIDGRAAASICESRVKALGPPATITAPLSLTQTNN